jgi:tRNA(fMet)-specific endonuclease VapC
VTLHYLLDTSIISSPISRTPDPFVIKRLDEYSDVCAIAAPVWHELTYGCKRMPAGKRRMALEAYLANIVEPSFPILPYDETAAAWHGQERARLESLGRPTAFVDGQIAAIAYTYGLVLITNNAKDFSRFKGIEILNWTRPRARG